MSGGDGGNSRAHPDCINAFNPYHECVEYCFQKIAEARMRAASLRPPPPLPAERTVHQDCTDASDPYHECDESCFKRIAQAKYEMAEQGTRVAGCNTPVVNSTYKGTRVAGCSTPVVNSAYKEGSAGSPVMNLEEVSEASKKVLVACDGHVCLDLVGEEAAGEKSTEAAGEMKGKKNKTSACSRSSCCRLRAAFDAAVMELKNIESKFKKKDTGMIGGIVVSIKPLIREIVEELEAGRDKYEQLLDQIGGVLKEM